MSLKENQEVIPTSKSHLKALVKKGREAAMKNAEDKDKPKSWPNRSGQPDFAARMKAKHGANWRTANADAGAARAKAAKEKTEVEEEVNPHDRADRLRKNADTAMDRSHKDPTKENNAAADRHMQRYSEFYTKNRRTLDDSYDQTAAFADRVMESVDKKYRYGATDRDLSPGEERNAQAELAPTRANIAGIKIGAGKKRMAGYVKDYRSKLGAKTVGSETPRTVGSRWDSTVTTGGHEIDRPKHPKINPKFSVKRDGDIPMPRSRR